MLCTARRLKTAHSLARSPCCSLLLMVLPFLHPQPPPLPWFTSTLCLQACLRYRSFSTLHSRRKRSKGANSARSSRKPGCLMASRALEPLCTYVVLDDGKGGRGPFTYNYILHTLSPRLPQQRLQQLRCHAPRLLAHAPPRGRASGSGSAGLCSDLSFPTSRAGRYCTHTSQDCCY